VPVLIAGSAARTCLGDEVSTFAALLRGESGASGLRYFPVGQLNVNRGYHISEPGPERPERAGRWLAECITRAAGQAGLDPAARVTVLVGTGLRELRGVERWAVDGCPMRPEALHFGGAVRRAVPGAEVTTIANACSAAGYALALGQDMLELGDADAVIVAGADSMTESMLAMIGRFGTDPADQVRPFDAARSGVLLGEGAAAVVLVRPGDRSPRPQARLLACGLSCDARHETAPDLAGICRAMSEALERACRRPDDVDLVYAHGTGTELNDLTEATALRQVFGAAAPGPLVTAAKGAVGHTSGASALTSLALAVQSLQRGIVPPVVGLVEPLAEGATLRLVIGRPRQAAVRLVQVNSFGFGGVNAVSLLAAA
jgi:3-oxoacyl-[acyl-carrier-protein] synthase II